MTIYLIDYENVHDAGMRNAEKVPEDSKLLLFFSNNEDKITMGNLMPIVSRLTLYRTRAGKQSLDMHLASYLGHEIGINGSEHRYIIVSKDHDYDNVALYWKDQGIDVSVQGALVPESPEQTAEKKEPSTSRTTNPQRRTQNTRFVSRNENRAGAPAQIPQPQKQQPATQPAIVAVEENQTENKPEQIKQPVELKAAAEHTEKLPEENAPAPEEKPEVLKEKPAAPGSPVLEPEITEEKPEAASEKGEKSENKKVRGRGRRRSSALTRDISTDVAEEGKTADKADLKKEQEKESQTVKEPKAAKEGTKVKENIAQKNGAQQQQTEKTLLNNKMMSKLTEAKLDAATVGKLTATIMKQFGKQNFKQIVYREIIKACGMQRGLEVYNLVKKLL